MSVKLQTIYSCSNCGTQSQKWQGRCPECGKWGTLQEKSFNKNSKTEKIKAEAANLGERKNGWQMISGAFGTREAMHGKYLTRAAAAYFGLWGNDLEEAFYPEASVDGMGDALDCSKHSYVLHFDKSEIPPVKAFWSVLPVILRI